MAPWPGYGAAIRVGDGPAAVSMLCDLFIDPRVHGGGTGRALLTELWRDEPRRMTFSSLHALALPLYTRFGLDAWWPLLYLAGQVAALRAPDGWAVTPSTPELVAAAEQRWTGADRLADHRAWAARPHGQPACGEPRLGSCWRRARSRATGTSTASCTWRWPPGASDETARDAVLAVLASLDAPGGRARVCLPAPHPAVRPLLAAGWRNQDMDLFMSSGPGLLDPHRAVPSPASA